MVVLIQAIENWAEYRNLHTQPLIWHETAEEVTSEVRRGRTALTQVTSATHH